jgi:hypothetical protein
LQTTQQNKEMGEPAGSPISFSKFFSTLVVRRRDMVMMATVFAVLAAVPVIRRIRARGM